MNWSAYGWPVYYRKEPALGEILDHWLAVMIGLGVSLMALVRAFRRAIVKEVMEKIKDDLQAELKGIKESQTQILGKLETLIEHKVEIQNLKDRLDNKAK